MQIESLESGYEKNGIKRFLATLGRTKKKNDLLDEIHELDINAEGRSLSVDEMLRKEEITKDLERFVLLKEVNVKGTLVERGRQEH